jgi:hypothetical protein
MSEADKKEKTILGLSPLNFVDEKRNRIDYNRAIEISHAIIRCCADEQPWPPEWDEEMNYITDSLWHRVDVGGVMER